MLNLSSARRVARSLLFLTASGCGGDSAPAGPGNTGGSGNVPTPPAISIAVSTSSLALNVGQTHQLSAAVAGSTNTAVSWSSSASTVASVSATGLVNAVGAGTATITAASVADPTKTATTTVAVTAPQPVTVALSAATLTFDIGATRQLSATVTGTTNTAVAWTTSFPAVATVSNGTVTGVGVGTATITATSVVDPTRSASAVVTVEAPNTGGNAPTLASGVAVSGISAAEDEVRVYRIVVPAGATLLDAVTTGPNGDLDLALSRTANPTSNSQILCASEGPTSNERCEIPNPTSGEWFILLYGFEAFTGATLKGTVSGGGAPTPGYALFLTPSTQSSVQGGTTQYAVTIQREAGFTGGVVLSASGLPAGVSATFSPNNVSGTASTLTLSIASTAATGSTGFVVTGIAAGLTNRSASGTVTVTAGGGGGGGGTPAYTLTVSPASAILVAGSSTTTTVSVVRSAAFSDGVTLGVSGLPSGVTASFSPSTIPSSGSTSTLTLTAASSAPVGAATATVRGSAAGLTDRTGTLSVTVTGTSSGPQVARIEVTPTPQTVYTSQTAIFRARAYDAADNDITAALLGTTQFFNWSVSNASVLGQLMVISGPNREIATLVGGSNNGSTSLTATLGTRTGNATLNVRVPTVLTLRATGTGSGTLSADPFRTGYAWEQVVNVTPRPDAYSYFAGWAGGCSGTTIPCQQTMNINRTISATFSPQPWQGLWGTSLTAVRQTDQNGRTCTWNVRFSSNGSLTVTYPRDATTGIRTVNVRIRTRVTAPNGTSSTGSGTCTGTDDVEDVILNGAPSSNGSFTLTGRVSAFDMTVSSGGLSIGPSVQGQLPVTISLRYNSSLGGSISGSATANTTAQPTLQAPPTP